MPEEFYAYLLDGAAGKHNRTFSVSGDKADLIRSYKDNVGKQEEEESNNLAGVIDPGDATNGLSDLLDRALRLGLSQSHLITIANSARPIFRGSAARFEVLEPVASKATLLEDSDNYKVYGLTSGIYADLIVRMRRLNSLDEALGELPGTVLMGLVATFDSFVSDVVREMLKRYPERYTSSDKEVRVRDILSLGSIDEFLERMIDDDVYLFARGSHEEQVKFIERSFNVPIAAHWKRYSDFIEIFERRNLIAHGERKFNGRYTRICSEAGYKSADNIVGQPIILSPSYLKQSADTLLEFAVVLTLSLWRKHHKDTEAVAFEKVNAIIFELIQSGRHRSAAAIAQSALDVKNSACTQLIRSMLTVNLASAQKHLKQNEAAIKTLDSIDWSAAADNFQICVASIKEDIEAICLLVPRVQAAQSVTADYFRTWPVFSFIREKPEFLDAFEKAYGEPLLRVNDAAIPEQIDSDEDALNNDP